MKDNMLIADEQRKIYQHNQVKSEIENEVNNEVIARAENATPEEAQNIRNVAQEFRGKAINEVVTTEREIGVSRVAARISQIIDFAFYVVYGLLALRLLLSLFSAKSSAGFVQFIRNITDPLYEPFRGIVASPSIEGGYTLVLPIVIAIIAYSLLHLGINGLLRLIAQRKTVI
jgi:uncharacterized protein YggT (Ycf19 family)